MKIPKQKTSLIRQAAIAFAVFLITIAIFSTLLQNGKKPETITLGELVERVVGGEIVKVVVVGDDLRAFKSGNTGDLPDAVSKKEPGVSITEVFANYGVNIGESGVDFAVEEESRLSFWLGNLALTVLPFLLIVGFFWWMMRQARGGMNQAFSFGKSTVKLFASFKDKITFKDVAGLKEVKQELEEIVDFLKNPKKFLDIGAKIPRGALLMGPPGTGKTLIARAIAGEANVPFFYMSASEFVEMFVGVGAARVRDLFDTAKKASPSIIFIDEIDAVGRERGAGLGGGHDEREQTLNQILVEMDGFERDTRIIVIAASVTGDTPVLIQKGGECYLMPIKEIIDQYYGAGEEDTEKLVNDDFKVLGYKNKNGNKHLFESAVFQSVRSVFRHKVNEIYEIDYLGGVIRATGNHSVFVRGNQGVRTKAVAELRPGDILVDIPYKVNRTNKDRREVRSYNFENNFNLELPVWQPLFGKFDDVALAHQYALANAGSISQSKIGDSLGFSQTTIGNWQSGVTPRELSRNYYQHKDILPEKVRATPDLMRLFGYYTAEGYSRKEIDFCLHIKEEEKVNDIKKLMMEIFGLMPSTERNITTNAINITYYSKPLAEFFAYYCGRGAHNKHAPSFIFTAPRNYFVEFLRGYFNGDGHQDKQGRIEITSVSQQLILELNWLSRMHGFKSYVHSFIAKEGRRINGGKPLKAATAWRIGFGKTQNPLGPAIGKQSITRAIVRSVKKVPYNDYVYDFCGCENEAFFGGASPLLLHNTNRPDILDKALLRPGRFDRRAFLDLPDINDREEILRIHAKGKILDKDVDLRRVAVRTPGFSGADLANLLNEAAISSARENKKSIPQQYILDAIEKVILGPERKGRVIITKEKEITAYHEAGHALVAASLKDADPVQKVSIISRGRAGGYTLKLPLEEKHLKTRNQFLADLSVALGGYVSEQTTFGDITTGSSNDLKEASDLARLLVMRYGMSKLGPLTFGKHHEAVFLGREISAERDYSEKTAQDIDVEVSGLMKLAHDIAKKVIIKRKTALKAIADALIDKETLEHDDFYSLLRRFNFKPLTL